MLKYHYAHTNKKKVTSQLTVAKLCEQVMQQIAQHLREQAGLSQIRAHWAWHWKWDQAKSNEEDGSESANTSEWYSIAETTKEHENILEWVHANTLTS